MPYIVTKNIKGKKYKYLVKNVRVGDKWKKYTKYLGVESKLKEHDQDMLKTLESLPGFSWLKQAEKEEKIYYGDVTKLAKDNFQISGIKVSKRLINAVTLIKMAAAQANSELGLLEKDVAESISLAGKEIIYGMFDNQFILDIFQAGAGTPINMNVNEVIANRAKEIIKREVHPNDHVNMAQSTNDVIPTAIRITCLFLLKNLVLNLNNLQGAFEKKSREFKNILKVGRTHLQDAVPITLGEE